MDADMCFVSCFVYRYFCYFLIFDRLGCFSSLLLLSFQPFILFFRFFLFYFFFFLFKQKTAYVMRISDWSSDVCSSDLFKISTPILWAESFEDLSRNFDTVSDVFFASETVRLRVSAKTSDCPPSFVIESIARLIIPLVELSATPKIGRASCRERV